MSLIKIANLANERAQFLQDYNIENAKGFSKDPMAQKAINDRRLLAERQINDHFKQQAKSSGSLSPQLQEMRTKMLNDLNTDSEQAVQNYSIDRTKSVAMQDPNKFKDFQSLSAESNKALGKSHGKELGATLGTIGGAGLGLLAGRRLPKNNKGILQQVSGALTGGAVGGVTAGALGSMRDEKRTGFNHEDILSPYEIADRITNQKKFR